MSYLLHISTAVPEFKVERQELLNFYARSLSNGEPGKLIQKLNFLDRRTKIETRYSCIPDYKGERYELFTEGDFEPGVEKRMALYREKIVPLACKAVDTLFSESQIASSDVTHLIAVSCTGLFAPGLEFALAEHFQLQQVEKTAINFLGCYAAVKALKQAHCIAQADPEACILIVSAELCSLHFSSANLEEELISNLLFADGAAAALLCGHKNKLAKQKTLLRIDAVGSAFIPDTAGLMTWELSASAFKMHLSSKVVPVIRENILKSISQFIGKGAVDVDYWAIHPGGAKIVEAVQESLGLSEGQVADSLEVLKKYGNMSSATILFILKQILRQVKETDQPSGKSVLACAFGPGLSMELLSLSTLRTHTPEVFSQVFQDAIPAPLL